jgi:hypothetical protein
MSEDAPPGLGDSVSRCSGVRGPVTICAVFLGLLFLTQLYLAVMTFQRTRIEAARAARYGDRVKAAESLLALQRGAIADLLTNYQKDAYQSSRVSTIMQQQLVATEYAITGLQLIALQNSQIIELLAAAP